MVSSDFHHGVRITETPSAQPIRGQSSNVVGIVGTAPQADSSEATGFPLDVPVLIRPGQRTRLDRLLMNPGAGSKGNLYDEVLRIWQNTPAPAVIAVRVSAATQAATAGTKADGTGVHALRQWQRAYSRTTSSFPQEPPTVLCAPGQTRVSSQANVVNDIVVTSGGSNYGAAPALTVAAPAFTAATATATVVGGVVTAITVTGGSGYASAPAVTIVGSPGTGATAVATLVSHNSITVEVTNGGESYPSSPTVTLTGGQGVTAIATAELSNGVVTGVTISNRGTGYRSAPTVSVGTVSNTAATATAIITDGRVTAIRITEAGSGYFTVPTVTLADPTSGTTATATALITNQRLTGFVITDPGEGYDAAPDVTITAPTAPTAATVTATVRQAFENAVNTALADVAEAIEAVAVVAGPNTDQAAAAAFAGQLGGRPGAERVYCVDNNVRTFKPPATYRNVPSEALVAGLIASLPAWESPSNRIIPGIVGASREIAFDTDTRSELTQLNAAGVAAIVYDGGWRLWGNRSVAANEGVFFLSRRRTADLINKAIRRYHRRAVDAGLTSALLDQITRSTNAFLDELERIGAIYGGSCWADRDRNPVDQVRDGKLVLGFDFSPVIPAESITFETQINDAYVGPALFGGGEDAEESATGGASQP